MSDLLISKFFTPDSLNYHQFHRFRDDFILIPCFFINFLTLALSPISKIVPIKRWWANNCILSFFFLFKFMCFWLSACWDSGLHRSHTQLWEIWSRFSLLVGLSFYFFSNIFAALHSIDRCWPPSHHNITKKEKRGLIAYNINHY